MEKSQLCDSLMKWLETFSDTTVKVDSLTSGVVMANALHQIAPEYFTDYWLSKIRSDVGDNWRLKVSNLRKVLQAIVDFYQEQLSQNIRSFPLPDVNKIGETGDHDELGRMLQLILGCAINCERKQQYIEAIMGMEETVQAVIMGAIQDLMTREGSPSGAGDMPGPASFHPHMKTLLEQLEAASRAKDESVQRCHELELQLSVIREEKEKLALQNEKCLERLEGLESGVDIGTSTLRYKDMKKQVDGLQDEVFKLENSRDEYRARVEVLERENVEIQTRNEDLQKLADEARSLKDEVDVLREMVEKVPVYEATIESYKKKLEELSDLKRQVKILEEKNSDYMQHNMELEEEVKKSGTWRPQLDLYKKQLAELHQKLADEAKKTDRHAFENKKLQEKMDALLQEKERLAMERDAMKDNIEELKCHVTALTSPDTSSRTPSDLSDTDLLELIPHEIKEKLARLQHENRVLKQRACEGGGGEQVPLLQAMISDLQERENNLTQENRWEDRKNSTVGFGKRRPSFSFIDSYLALDSSKKLKLFKRNLKWASESDLLVLRRPPGLVANFLAAAAAAAAAQHNPSIPSLLSNSPSPTCSEPHSKDIPIIIHHIHEFKMPPSPSHDDSGCCRTSPSSCEGSEEHRRVDNQSPDYSNTLDSGVSGVYRCLTPIIPSLVEECTTHHLPDIFPGTVGPSSTPSVMHHTHPAHAYSSHSPLGYPHCFNNNRSVSGRKSGCYSDPPRPNSVCSFSSPCSYNGAVSPSIPQLPGSPSQSPPPPNISPGPESPTPPHSPPSSPSSPHPSTVLHSGRRTYVRSPLPPESPTPHNSPRLPNSIHATRTRSIKVYSTPGITEGEYSADSSTSPKVLNGTSDLASSTRDSSNESSSQEKQEEVNKKCNKVKEAVQIQQKLELDMEEKISHSSKATDLDKVSSKLQNLNEMNHSSKDVLVDHSASSSGKEVNEPVTPRTSSNVCNGSTPTISVAPTKVTPILSVPASIKLETSQPKAVFKGPGSISPVGSTALKPSSSPKCNANRVRRVSPPSSTSRSLSSIKRHVEPPRIVGCINKTGMPPRYQGYTVGDRKPSDKATSQSGREQYVPLLAVSKDENSLPRQKTVNRIKMGGIKPRTPEPAKEPVIKAKCSSEVGCLPIASRNDGSFFIAQKPPIYSVPKAFSELQTSSEPQVSEAKPDCSSKVPANSRKPSIILNHNTLNNKTVGHVTFKEPIVVNDLGKTSSLPTSRVITSITNAPNRQKLGSSQEKSVPRTDVKLLSDTLFTHFVLSANNLMDSPERSKESTLSATDTDTDLELMERRLTMGMYAAPLVSSESYNSITNPEEEGDIDPSATDYNTDNNSESEFNPRQFKPYGNTLLVTPLKAEKSEAKVDTEEDSDTKSLPGDLTDAAAVLARTPSLRRTYSFFRKQSKRKKEARRQNQVAKLKNKKHRAQALAQKTFNAMFTMCTP